MAKTNMSYKPSAQFSTSTGKGHRFIPQIPQNFDCRAQAHITPEIAYVDISVKNEQSKTSYSKDFSPKVAFAARLEKSPKISNLQYLRTVEEKFSVSPPVAPSDAITEIKYSYSQPHHRIIEEEVQPVTQTSKCYASKVGRKQQPRIPANQKGFWKWCDPYLTTYKTNFVNIGKTNDRLLTFYNKTEFSLPAKSGNKEMFDKMTFSNVLPLRQMPRPQTRVPNLGMQSEYQNTYVKQSFSDLSSFLHDSGAEFEDSLAPASRWQTLVPPGMYCSEYCTIGRGSARSLLKQTSEKRQIVRAQNCCRI